jgi:hypothetical protein
VNPAQIQKLFDGARQIKKPDHRQTRLFGDVGAVASAGEILFNRK